MPEDLVLPPELPDGVVAKECHQCGKLFYVWEDNLGGAPLCEPCYVAFVEASNQAVDEELEEEEKSPWEE